MSKPKVLYVDDQEANLFLFEEFFEDNYTVLVATGALSGLEVIELHDDLKVVISDMSMPEIDGLEFVKRAHQKRSDINYYILTAFDNTEEIRKNMDEGIIRDLFRKPFNADQIAAEIDKILKEENSVNAFVD